MIFPSLIIKIERWKFNKDYGVYVSTLGNFKDRHKRRLSVWVDGKTGYCRIKTESGLKYAHRLVMLTWRHIPDAENLTVDHLNHNKRDNSLQNLEWVTRIENLRRAKTDTVFIKDKSPEDCSIQISRKERKKKALNKYNPLIRDLVAENKPITFIVSDNEFETVSEAIDWAVTTIVAKNCVQVNEEELKPKIENIFKNRMEGRVKQVTRKYGLVYGVKLSKNKG